VSEEQPADVAGGRSFEERVMLAMPTVLLRALQRGFARLPPGSQLRRRGLKRLMTLGWAAASREDYELPLACYEPDVEIHVPAKFARTLGLAESYHGHQGFLDVWRDYRQDMTETRIEPDQIIDLGDPVAVRTTFATVGRSSGVAIRETRGNIFYFSPRGLFARQEVYPTWEDTLAALERRE
jgi:ketosteroid isomerase-like protein